MPSPATHTLHTSFLSQRSRWAADQAISFLMQQGVENPGCISLAAGLVDEDSLPAEPVREAVTSILSDGGSARSALQYGTTQGRLDLRGCLLDYMAAQEGVHRDTLGYDASHIVVTTGSQQLLSLLCETLLDPGDICIVGAPTYFVFLGCLAGVGAEPISVPLDENGMQPDLLEQALGRLNELGRLPKVKMIYVVSEFDNPSGVSVSLERRKTIVDIANRWSIHNRLLILEDSAYRDLRFEGDPLPSLLACDDSKEQVIYTQTFSKTLSPGLRVGFGVLPRDVMKPVLDRKGNEDFGSANFTQAVVTRMLKSGAFQRHVQHVRASYTRKRDAMVAAAEKFFRSIPGVSWHRPTGGLYVWMTLPPQVPTGFQSPLFQTAVKNHGVMYVPGELCFAPAHGGRPKNHMRLSYGVQTPAGITDGMRRLANAVSEVLGNQPA